MIVHNYSVGVAVGAERLLLGCLKACLGFCGHWPMCHSNVRFLMGAVPVATSRWTIGSAHDYLRTLLSCRQRWGRRGRVTVLVWLTFSGNRTGCRRDVQP